MNADGPGQQTAPVDAPARQSARIAVASGKGGVGKSNSR